MANKKIKSVAILTSGGDSPGMNAAVRAIVKNALFEGLKPYLVYEGFKGIIEKNIKEATAHEVDDWINYPGTRIYSARYLPMHELETQKLAVQTLKELGIDALVVIGGDGSFMGASKLSKLGLPTIGIPGTIDNDIAASQFTIGFDSALNAVIANVDSIRSTSESHGRVAIVEVMGRHCPDLTVFAGYATGAEVVITQDNLMSEEQIIERINLAHKNGHRSIIVLVAEHIFGELNNFPSLEVFRGKLEKLGYDARVNVLGHLQRGWIPTAMERVYATRMGIYAVDLLLAGKSERVIGVQGEDLCDVDIAEAVKMKRPNRSKMLKDINDINIK